MTAWLAAALVLVFTATYLVLDRTEHRPGWLTVEMPSYAVAGRTLEVEVTLKGPLESTMIDCDLQRANGEKKGWGFLASGGPPRPVAGVRSHAYVFDVPVREDTAFAFVLVFLSPSGRWPDGTRAATSAYIPVRGPGPAGPAGPLRRARLYRYPTAAEAAAREAGPAAVRPRGTMSAWVHPAIAALLLAAAVLSVTRSRRRAGPKAEGDDRTVWLILAAAMALCAALELSGLAGHVADWGRRWAAQAGLYESRQPFQKAVMAAVASASLGLFVLFLRAVRRPGPHRALWGAAIGLAAYLALSFVSALSFHAVDVVRGLVWRGWSAVDAARGAGALAALLAAGLSAKSGRRPGPT
jgi:hypothetical protein